MMGDSIEPTRVFPSGSLAIGRLPSGYRIAGGYLKAITKEASRRKATLLHMHHFPCPKCGNHNSREAIQ